MPSTRYRTLGGRRVEVVVFDDITPPEWNRPIPYSLATVASLWNFCNIRTTEISSMPETFTITQRQVREKSSAMKDFLSSRMPLPTKKPKDFPHLPVNSWYDHLYIAEVKNTESLWIVEISMLEENIFKYSLRRNGSFGYYSVWDRESASFGRDVLIYTLRRDPGIMLKVLFLCPSEMRKTFIQERNSWFNYLKEVSSKIQIFAELT